MAKPGAVLLSASPKAAGVAVIVAPGTHDTACSPRSVYRSARLGGTKVFLEPLLGERFRVRTPDGPLAFSGLAWDPQATPRDYLAAYQRALDRQ